MPLKKSQVVGLALVPYTAKILKPFEVGALTKSYLMSRTNHIKVDKL